MMNLLLHGIASRLVARATRSTGRHSDRKARARRRRAHQPALRWRGGEEHPNATSRPTATAETAWLFLQLVVRISSSPADAAGSSCRTGCSSATAVGGRIKKRLLSECHLHTVVRLPRGVRAVHGRSRRTCCSSRRPGRTKEIWFYEIAPPEGRKKYSKTSPMQFEEFADCQAWWGGPSREGRVEGQHAWAADLESTSNPGTTSIFETRTRRRPGASPTGGVSRGADRDEKQIMLLLDELATIVGDGK